jgi:hypothetical protein
MFRSAQKHPFGVKPRKLKGDGIHPMVKRSFRGKYLPHEGTRQEARAERLHMESEFEPVYDSERDIFIARPRSAPIIQKRASA